jgi:drug/metabolite transporter (DMT)-like permease
MKWFAICCALCVALCWGLYGPTLSRARSADWGPFKPYLFIGIAYVVIAIAGGSLMMRFVFNDSFDYTGKYFPAMQWGFLAGCLGAFGALGLTFALTKAGGSPAYVMPIVFGGAVTVNAIVAYFKLHGTQAVSPMVWVGMVLAIIGTCLTAYYTPHGHAPAKKRVDAVAGTAAEESLKAEALKGN